MLWSMTENSKHRAPRIGGKVRSLRHDVGERIARARERRGLTQRELSERTGIPAKRLSLIETGDTAPRLEDLPALREILGVPLDVLLGVAGSGPAGPLAPLREAVQAFAAAAGAPERDALVRLLRLAAAGAGRPDSQPSPMKEAR